MIAAPPHVTLAVSPSHVVLAPGSRRLVHVGATGYRGPVAVTATVTGYSLDPHGRPELAPAGGSARWLVLRPRRLTLGHAGSYLAVSSRRPARTRAGDYSAVVLLTASERTARSVVVRMRIGLVVSVRVPGRLVHRLVIRRIRLQRHVRRRVLDVTFANDGNVVEHLDDRAIRVTLVARGRAVSRMTSVRRDLLPHSAGIASFAVPARVRGAVVARIELRGERTRTARSFRLRL